ncbi:MAG: type IV pilin protein [Burkholderiales bacterium]|nr:prepilin-type N-terminal cleavage/methylation domain-containing protein [Burkholderiales bacterium]MDE1927238.1 type IV pilin protein [Burkholderiales bacterium]MDE2158994.1 type IV pilin protein [Burkholderiales bacterium]
MRPPRGFTLVECAVVCAVALTLATVALPDLRATQRRAARIDATAALTRVQQAQEAYRALHGGYAPALESLRGVAPRSGRGLYAITLEPDGADAYRASAVARGDQAGDRGCATITLDVRLGFSTPGPDAGCWNR